MTACIRSIVLASICWSAAALYSQPVAKTPVEIGGDRQLFLDDQLLDMEQSRGVSLTLNPPQNIHRVLKPETPWEALGFIFYCSVVEDGGEAKLYYGTYDAEKKRHLCLATSADGQHWQRPNLGLRMFQGGKSNNLMTFDAIEASVFIDPHAPPEKRYRLPLTRYWPDPAKAGMYMASSADGIHWQMGEQRLLPFIPDSQPSALWDEDLRNYVIYLRAWDPIRTIARVAVPDLEAPWPYDASVTPYEVWGKGKIPTLSRELPRVMAPDAQDPENLQLYTSVITRYPYAPGLYIAFPAAYRLYLGPNWASRAVNTNDGTFDIQFAASRDGIAWHRWRQPYVSAGLHEDLELKLVSMGPGFVRRGPWLYQYFVGWTATHGQPVVWDKDRMKRIEAMNTDLGGIYCAAQRVDGFVSMDAGSDPGTLITRPLMFKGGRLLLNIHTAGIGSARVSLLGPDDIPVPGFSDADCDPICADAIDHEVRWKSNASLEALAGKPVRLQFSLQNAKLYALQFAPVVK